MAVGWILALHGLATGTAVISFLCGNWPIIRRTPIASIHRFLTYGAYDYFLLCVGLVCGSKGTDAILEVENFFCNRPNPALENNCIGERNTRYFMAFLLWHFLICVYGVVAIGLVIAGELKESRIIQILTECTMALKIQFEV